MVDESRTNEELCKLLEDSAKEFEALKNEHEKIKAQQKQAAAEHNKTVEALCEREELFRMVADCSYDWEAWRASDGTFRYVSPSCQRITGHAASEFLANPNLLLEIAHPDDRAKIREHLDEVTSVRKGHENEYEFRIITSAGETRWIGHLCTIVLSEDGKWLGRRESNRDITKHKLKEIHLHEKDKAALHASEEKYHRLFEAVSDPIFLVEIATGKILETNVAAVKTYGYSHEELLARRSIDLSAEPEETQKAERSDSVFVPIRWHRKKNGIAFPVEITASRFTWDRRDVILVAIRDITDRKKAEDDLKIANNTLKKREEEAISNYASLHSVFESPQDIIIFSLDASYCYKAFTECHKQTIKKIFGVEIALGMCMLDAILNPEDREKAQKNFDRTLQGEFLRFEEEYGDPNLYRTYYDNIYNPIFDQTGNVIGLSVFVIDITERKRAEEDLKSINEQLIAFNATRDKFFSIIAHDLRSPFQPLLGLSSLLKESYDSLPSAEIEEYIDSIHSIAKRVFELLQNLLEWAAAQSGKIQNNPVHINLRLKAADILHGMKENYTQKNIEVHNEIGMNISVFADDRLVHSVLQNIVSNAIKFSMPGGKITIQAAEDTSPQSLEEIKQMIQVSITDTGIGISKDRLGSLFTVDKYETTMGTNQEVGSGLGLVLCKEFIEKIGGKIWVESVEGKGSTFRFTIPKA